MRRAERGLLALPAHQSVLGRQRRTDRVVFVVRLVLNALDKKSDGV